ncbi:hypothetical protein [Clostridium celatum]|uniref:hypothetical protein n=1 Tax=Clostridium celatum TaxID=36834 RepID=UPI00189C086E|nr:hypothetical protein [Clostridium celatum]
MRLKKVFYCTFSIIMLSTIVLTNIILRPTDKITKTKVTINYNNRIINEDIQNSDEVRVSIPENSSSDGIIQLPIPDANKQLTLDAL